MNAKSFEWAPQSAEPAFTSKVEALLDESIAAGKLPSLHCMLVAHESQLLFERYYAGHDENWGRPPGHVTFGPDTLHDLRSVTKSIVGLLYGIALADGKVPSPDMKLMASFPNYLDLAADPARQRITISHVLTMTMGTEWDESLPWGDPANSERAMAFAPDRYRFILERPIVAAPGTRWIYNGGATMLLGELIARGTGRALPDFAHESLFAPLGIDDFEWGRYFDGTPSAATGLRLKPRDLARIGLMILQNGNWCGRTVVPASWLNASLKAHTTIEEPARYYGFHWNLGEWPFKTSTGPRTDRWISAYGNGGQRLVLFPDLNVLVVTTSGHYGQLVPRGHTFALLREIVYGWSEAGNDNRPAQRRDSDVAGPRNSE